MGWVRRKLEITPQFHQIDLLGVVHNAQFLIWFEQGRLQLMFDIIPLQIGIERGLATPVIDNRCRYHHTVRYGDSLVLHTQHKKQKTYQGRLDFEHSLVSKKDRREIASGMTCITLVDWKTRYLLKEWPEDLWELYQSTV